MTDACRNGIGGVITQGKDWKSAKVAAFYSAKMSSAQRIYLVHEQELLAGVETMLRHCNMLLEQKDLSGVENGLPDALSRMYEFDAPGMIHVPSEYLHHDLAVYASVEAMAISTRSRMQSEREHEQWPVPAIGSTEKPPGRRVKLIVRPPSATSARTVEAGRPAMETLVRPCRRQQLLDVVALLHLQQKQVDQNGH